MKKTTLNTASLKAGTLLRFHKAEFGYGILSVFENMERFLIVKSESEIPPSLANDDLLELYFWSDKGGAYTWNSRILGTITDREERFLVISHDPNASWSAERNCVRTTVPLLFEFFTFSPSDDARIFESAKTHFHSATTLELTDHEAVIETAEDIEGPIIKGHLKLNNSVIDIAGKVSSLAGGKYRLQMLSMEEKDRKQLLDFIYRNCRE